MNICTVAGTLISLLGFVLTLWQLFSLKKTTRESQQRIEAEVSSAQQKIKNGLAINNVVNVSKNLGEAIDHINKYGSGHTDAIITTNKETAEYFMNKVDSGSVLLNCSTRFADGFRYGFGAEVGISTSKLHARGPVGLEGLVSYKYKLYGNGDIVADYASGEKKFKHIRRDI